MKLSHSILYSGLIGSLTLFSIAALAVPLYQPKGTNVTNGEVTNFQRASSYGVNPASAAAIINMQKKSSGNTRSTIDWTTSGGIEYGNVQELFDLIDNLSSKYKPSDPGTDLPPGQNPGDKPDEGINIGDIIDEIYPDFRPALEAALDEVTTQVAILALIKVEGYAKAFASSELSFLSGQDRLGGNWSLGVSWAGTAKTFGIVDEIEFDLDGALDDLINQFGATTLPASGLINFDVEGDIDFIYNAATKGIGLLINNDSLLLTKGAQIAEISLSYSRDIYEKNDATLYLGADAKYYNLKLSRLSARFGDITDSKELFDYFKDLNYQNDNGFGIDIGALWVKENYHLGATLTNINEPTFNYPTIDLSNYSNERIINFLRSDEEYTMERQLKLEAGLYTKDHRWALYTGIDTNDAVDPVGDKFQWASISGSYHSPNFWMPDFRIGYRENLAGSKVSYLSAGLTAFNFLDLDISSALKTVSIKGDDLPRGLMLSLGFNFNF